MNTSGSDDLRRDVEAHQGIAVLRGGGAARGWNGIQYRTGLSGRNVGATQLSMNVATIPPGGVAAEYGPNLEYVVENGPGDFIYIEPGVPHEVFNASATEPLVAVVARSDASEWEHIIPFERPSRAPGASGGRPDSAGG
jgi:uncharacterized RmlC-like cupin family protein